MAERIMFAISSSVFAAIYLGALIVYGGEWTRNAAAAAAFLACVSQFCGPDPKAYRVSIYSAYGAFAAGLFAYFCMVMGK